MFSNMALSGYHGLFNNVAFPTTTSPMVQLVCVHALCLWESPSPDASTMVPLPASFVLDPLAAEAQTYPHHAPPSPAASAMYLQTTVTLKPGRSQLLSDLPCKRGATIKPSRVEVRLSEEVVGSYWVQNGEIGIPEGQFHERGRITPPCRKCLQDALPASHHSLRLSDLSISKVSIPFLRRELLAACQRREGHRRNHVNPVQH
jgi:hypothetical protein